MVNCFPDHNLQSHSLKGKEVSVDSNNFNQPFFAISHFLFFGNWFFFFDDEDDDDDDDGNCDDEDDDNDSDDDDDDNLS